MDNLTNPVAPVNGCLPRCTCPDCQPDGIPFAEWLASVVAMERDAAYQAELAQEGKVA